MLIFQPKPIKNPPPVRATTEDELGDQDGVNGEGEEGGAGVGGGGGAGPGFGPGYGDGSGGTGDQSGSANRPTSIQLKNVRHIDFESAKTRVIFTPTKSGEALINIASIGADLEDNINVVESSLGAVENGLVRLSLTAGERVDISVTLERECEGGLRVSAREV